MAGKKKTSKRKPAQPETPPAAPPGPGRPSEYRLEFCQIAAEMCAHGATDVEIADSLDVSARTLYRWLAAHEEFRQAMKLGKEPADDRVERSLYHRAVGYEHDAVKIFPGGALGPVVVPYREHVPPDPGSALKWLANRRPEKWRDKVDHAIEVSAGDAESLRDRLAAALAARKGSAV